MKYLLLATLIASAEPTDAQIAACYADALRLCAAHIGDHSAMRACMIEHKSQLSQACKDAFK